MSSKIQIKRGTTAQWASSSNDTTLAPGQLGVEYLTSGYSRLKVGTDNSTHSSTDWADLNYLTPSTQTYREGRISDGTLPVLTWDKGNSVQLGRNNIATDIQGSTISLGQLTLSTTALYPSINGGTDLGTSSYQFGNIHIQDATSTTPASGGNGIYFGNDTYPTIYYSGTSLYFNPSGTSTTNGRLTLSTSAFYPSTDGGCDLGTPSYGWDYLYMSESCFIKSGSKYIAYDASASLFIGAANEAVANPDGFSFTHLVGQSSASLNIARDQQGVTLWLGSFYPEVSADSRVDYIDLGKSATNSRWRTVYCTSVSESSDVSLKSDIHYLDPRNLLSTSDVQEEQTITVEDVLEFISELKPATFVYKSKDISTIADAKELDMEAIHLGIIANDIEDSKLFEYVASKHETTTTLENGTAKVDKNLSIKPTSLAVAALTACKYLINQVNELKEMLNNGNN